METSTYTPDTAELAAWPLSEETRKCPFPFYKSMATSQPVHRFDEPSPTGAPIFLVTGWEQCSEVLTHADLFDNNLTAVMPELEAINPLPRPDIPTFYRPEAIAFTAGDDHKVKRSWALAMFDRNRIVEDEEIAVEVADRLIDSFIDRGSCDFREEFGDPLPLEVLVRSLSLPKQDASQIKEWADVAASIGIKPMPTPEDVVAVMAAFDGVNDYVIDLCEKRLAAPMQDYLSQIVRQQIERDGSFDPNAVAVHMRSMLMAGYHTTAGALADAVAHLANNPGMEDTLREDPKLIAKFVEESLRLESVLQFHPRRSAVDTEIAGVPVPANSLVFVCFAAGNRDEQKFPDPDEFVLDRPRIMHHLGFGRGIHRCPGAPLAQMELRVALTRLLERMENIRIDPEKTDLTPVPSVTFRLPTAVHITFDKRA